MPPDWRLLAASVKKQERVETIIQRLNAQYPETPIPLDHSDAFTLLIAVLLGLEVSCWLHLILDGDPLPAEWHRRRRRR